MLHRVTLKSLVSIAGLLVTSLTALKAAETHSESTNSPPSGVLPNVILCMTDDQGWGDTGYNGHPILKTPSLDDMASHGLRLDRFYAAQHNCSPTRASVLTGRHPNRVRCYAWGHDLPLGEETIAEVAKAHGYATGHFGKWHLGGIPNSAGGDGRGVPVQFDQGLRHPGNQGFDVWFSAGNWFERNPPPATFFENGQPVQALRGDTSDIIAERAIQFMRTQVQGKKPFLMVVWFPSPHGPYDPQDEDKARYLEHGEDANFYGEMAAVDRAMGKLRTELVRLEIRDHTLLWFNSDNGAAGGSTGGLSGGKGSLQEGGIRVPCLIEWPAKIYKPRRTSTPAGTVDIFPTICEIIGVANQRGRQPLDGASLLPLMEDKPFVRSQPLGFEDTHTRTGKPRDAAWIDGRWKLLSLARPDKRTKYADKAPAEMLPPGHYLFDLEADPAELRDLKKAQPERFAAMKKALLHWQSSVAQSAAEYPFELLAEPEMAPVLGGKVHTPLLVNSLKVPALRALWAEGQLSKFDAQWDMLEGALRGRCSNGEKIIGESIQCTTPLRHSDAILQISVKLHGRSTATIKIGCDQEASLTMVIDDHLSLLETNSSTNSLKRNIVHVKAPLKDSLEDWQTVTLEYVGRRASLRLNDKIVGTVDGLSVGGQKHSLSLEVEGNSASFRDLRVWEIRSEQP